LGILITAQHHWKTQRFSIDGYSLSRQYGILKKNKIIAKATFLDQRFKITAFNLLENVSNAQKLVSEELTMMISTKYTEMENEMIQLNLPQHSR